MQRYAKPILMLATPVLAYLSICAVGFATGNAIFDYVAVYLAACSAMLMLFFVTRHQDDHKNALSAVALAASVYFASFYMIQMQGPYQDPPQIQADAVVSVMPNATIQSWLADRTAAAKLPALNKGKKQLSQKALEKENG